ncbi:MAG: type 4a pilus biogenesis protein PilO [Clostridium sp.]
METKRKGYLNYLIALSLREKIILTGSMILFLVLIFYIGAIKPVNKGKNNAESSIKSLEMKKDSLLTENKNSDKTATDIYYAEEKLESLKSEVPKSEKQVTLLNNIISMEKGSHVGLDKISFSNDGKTEDGSLNIYGASLSVTGNYKEILTFIKMLEGNKRKLQVKEVTVSKNPKNYTGNINLNYFSINNKGNGDE